MFRDGADERFLAFGRITMGTQATCEPSSFTPTKPPFKLVRHQVDGGKRVMRCVFSNDVVAGNFIMHAGSELIRRAGANLLQLHPRTHGARRIPPGTADFQVDGGAQFLSEREAFRPDQNFQRLRGCEGGVNRAGRDNGLRRGAILIRIHVRVHGCFSCLVKHGVIGSERNQDPFSESHASGATR